MPSLIPTVTLQANQPAEFWLFVVTNVLTLFLGSALTVIAFIAYRREGLTAFLLVTVGFGLVTLGTVVEILYELGVKGIHITGLTAFGRELLFLRTVEGVLIAAGLVILIYSFKHV